MTPDDIADGKLTYQCVFILFTSRSLVLFHLLSASFPVRCKLLIQSIHQQ